MGSSARSIQFTDPPIYIHATLPTHHLNLKSPLLEVYFISPPFWSPFLFPFRDQSVLLSSSQGRAHSHPQHACWSIWSIPLPSYTSRFHPMRRLRPRSGCIPLACRMSAHSFLVHTVHRGPIHFFFVSLMRLRPLGKSASESSHLPLLEWETLSLKEGTFPPPSST